MVVNEARCECEQAQRDAGAEAFDRAAAVLFEGELAFAGPEHRFDPLANRAQRSVAALLVLRSGLRKRAPIPAMICSNSPAKPLSAMTV